MGPGMLRSAALWLDQRLHVTRLFASTAGHSVPASAHSWFYVFGSGTLLCFIGVFIAMPIVKAATVYAYEDIFGSGPRVITPPAPAA